MRGQGHFGSKRREAPTPIELPEHTGGPGWEQYYDHSERLSVSSEAPPLEQYGRSAYALRQPPPAPPPCPALEAILMYCTLRERASRAPLSMYERSLATRVETGLRQADVRSRRIWKRHTISRPVRVGASDVGRLDDVSAGGMRISGLDVLPGQGTLTEISMRVRTQDGEQTVVFPCRVAWVDYHSRTIGVAFGAATRWE